MTNTNKKIKSIRSLIDSRWVKTPRGSLGRVRKIIQDEQRWLQNSLFDSSPDGPSAHHSWRTATRCCLAGALEFISEEHRPILTDLIISVIEETEPEFPRNRRTGRVAISEWNDMPGRTQAEVLRLLDQVQTRLAKVREEPT